MPWTEDSPLATAFGAASGFLNGVQQGQDHRAEIARQTAIDKANATALAVKQQDEQRKAAADAAKDAQKDRLEGTGLVAPDFTPKPVKGAKATDPQQATVQALLARADWYDQQGAYDAAKADRTQAAALLGAAKTAAQTTQIGATTDETKARTTLLKSDDWQIRTEKPREFKEKLDATVAANKAALGARYAIARERIQGELERAGMSHSNSGAGAEMAIQKWIAGENYSSIVRSTMDDYNQQMSDYRAAERENEQNSRYNAQNPDGPQLPVIQISAPQPPVQPIIIMTPAGPRVVMPPTPKPPSGNGNKKPAASPTATPPAPPSSGNPVMDWIHAHFGGDDATPAAAAPNGKVVSRADAIAIGAKRGLAPDAAIRDAQSHGYTVR